MVEGGRPILWDTISEAPMATEFLISRFLAYPLAIERQRELSPRGWAIFTDCDVLVRKPVSGLLQLLDPRYAVMVVKHDHRPVAETKMRGEVQMRYSRKNWSSAMAFNLDHPANQRDVPTVHYRLRRLACRGRVVKATGASRSTLSQLTKALKTETQAG